MSTTTTTPDATIKLPKPHIHQRAIIDNAARFKVLNCGRRFGKSWAARVDAIQRVLAGQKVWFTAITHSNVNASWRWFLQKLQDYPLAQVDRIHKDIYLPNGAYLGARSLMQPDNLRGSGLDHIYMDEAAFIRGGAYTWEKVLQPMLLEREGSAWLMSSPFGRNWFWQYYTKAERDDEWAAWTFTAYDNPKINPRELDRLKVSLPDRVWQEEYMAEFLEDGAVFRKVLDAIYDGEMLERGEDGKQYLFGIDVAKMNDYFVIVILDPETNRVVHVDRTNQLDYTYQLSRLQGLAERFPPSGIVLEVNIEKMFHEQVIKAGLPVVGFTTTNPSKQLVIEELAMAFENGAIYIPNHTHLVSELRAFEGERRAGGMMVYGAPAGMHDDCVIALALAWHGVSNPREAVAFDYNPFFSM